MRTDPLVLTLTEATGHRRSTDVSLLQSNCGNQ